MCYVTIKNDSIYDGNGNIRMMGLCGNGLKEWIVGDFIHLEEGKKIVKGAKQK